MSSIRSDGPRSQPPQVHAGTEVAVPLGSQPGMNRRQFLVLSGLGLAALPGFELLEACGGTATPAATKDDGKIQTLSIRVSHEAPVNYINDTTLKKWAATVKSKSDGKITVEVFPAGQLYTDANAMQAMVTSRGQTVQMVSTSAFFLETYSPAVGVLELPYIFKSASEFQQAFQSTGGRLIKQKMAAKGVVVLGDIIDLGPLIIMNNKKPIQTAADMRGLKVRNLSGQVTADAIRALGASSVDIPFPQVALALSQGTVDAAVGTFLAWKALLSDVAKYGTDPGMWKVGYIQVVQGDWWKSLNSATSTLLATTLSDAVKETAPTLDAALATAKQVLVGKGREITVLPQSEQDVWKKLTAKVITDQTPTIGRDIVDAFTKGR